MMRLPHQVGTTVSVNFTLEEVVRGRSEIRNKVIVRIFKEAKKIEQWGRGVQRAISLCLEKGLKRPEIVESGLFVKFVFYRKQDAKHSEKMILDYLLIAESITTTKAMELLTLSKSRTNTILHGMVDKGLMIKELMIKEGYSRATKYTESDQ